VNWLRPRRPSPALVISIIALVMAMGGTGYAALSLPKNSVGSKQLKKNAVTGSKVKNSSLTGADIKNGSLKGADLNIGSLGTVPNSNHANSADNANHAGSADSAGTANELDYAKHFDFTIGPNAPVGTDFLTIGPFTLTAVCDINNANTDTATLQIRSTENHFALDGGPEVNDNPANTEETFRSSSSSPTGTPNIEYSSVTSGAIAPSGAQFWGLFPVHVSPPGQPGKCRFQGLYWSTL
jgi:hypothetical protein